MNDEEQQLHKEWRTIVIEDLKTLKADIKSLQGDLRDALSIQKDVEASRHRIETLEKNTVSKSEFEPLKKLVWAVATAVILGVVSALLALLVKGIH